MRKRNFSTWILRVGAEEWAVICEVAALQSLDGAITNEGAALMNTSPWQYGLFTGSKIRIQNGDGEPMDTMCS